MADYLKYQQRKLREQLSLSPYNQLQSEVRQVGRETQRIAKQTDATLKRQNVPIGARLEGARELQTNYAQNIGAAYERVSQQDAQRKQGIMGELAAVNMQIAEAKEAKEANDKGILNTAIQVGGTVLGALVGSVVPGVGTLAGAQAGAAGGQAISGGYNIAKGDATAQDWSNLGQGIISGVSLGAEQANLKSVKAENAEAMQYMTQVWNNKDISDPQRKWMYDQITLGLGQGMTMNEIIETFKGIIWDTDDQKVISPDTDDQKVISPDTQDIEIYNYDDELV